MNEVNWDESFKFNKTETSIHFGKYIVKSKDLTASINEWIDYQGLDYKINSKNLSKLLREITGIQTSVVLRINNKQSRCIVLNREKVENELTNRIFKNILTEPVESLEFPCLIENDPLENWC